MAFSLRADSPRVGSIWREGFVLQEAAGCRRRLHVCPPFVGARWRTEGGLDMTCGHGWLCSAERAKACFLRGHVPDPYAFACWRCLLDCGLLHAQPGSALRAMHITAPPGFPHQGPTRLFTGARRLRGMPPVHNFQITQPLSALCHPGAIRLHANCPILQQRAPEPACNACTSRVRG